jgi:hypothetical protein
MLRLVLSLPILYSTVVSPFDKEELALMKTTSDLERCVLKKIFRDAGSNDIGLLINNETGALSVSFALKDDK